MSKLGFVIIEDFDGALRWAIQNKPTAVEFMLTRPLDDQKKGLMRDLVVASPKTLLVIRAYPDDYDHGDFQERMLSWSEPFREVSNKVVAHSINEPVIFNPDAARRLNEYEVGFIERMSAEGLIPMCFCLSESHLVGPTIEDGVIKDWGNLPLWQHMAQGVAMLSLADGFLGLNEYDWPNWDSSRDQGYKWRLGHWEVNLHFIRERATDYPVTVGIGESVLDGKIMTSRLPEDDPRHDKPWGYRKRKSKSEYLLDIGAIERDSYGDPRVAFFLLFAWAPGHRDWNTYDVSIMGDLLAEYLRQNPPIYWEPKEEETMTDSPLAIWREGVPLDNYSMNSKEKTIIVLHSTDGTFTEAVNWFLNPDSGVAAHYIIGRGHAGEPKIYQMVREDDSAHHAGDWEMNLNSIGIECADDKLDYLTGPQRARLIALCKDIVARNPIDCILLHREVTSTKCPQAISDFAAKAIIKEVFGGPVEEVDYKKKYEDLRNGVVAARNTLDAVLDE